jgi:WD40 repeat protein
MDQYHPLRNANTFKPQKLALHLPKDAPRHLSTAVKAISSRVRNGMLCDIFGAALLSVDEIITDSRPLEFPRTPDGTTLLTHNEDEGLRTFILPPDLLSPFASPVHLRPYSLIYSPSRVYSTAIYPLASLSSPESFIFLASPRNSPIRLHSLLHPNLLSSYSFINPRTEKFEAAYSLLIPSSKPTTFFAGSNSRIAIFDITRYGVDGPTVVLKTIPTRHSPATTETMKGLVTAMALTPDSSPTNGVLAAGTYTRQVGLYAGDGRGDVIGVFSLLEGKENNGGGGGVTQLLWSHDRRYLYIVERMSDEISVYDIRVSGKRVESFKRRNAMTNQRIGVDIAHGLGGEVVGGGTDGIVNVWNAAHGKMGDEEVGHSVGSWKAHDDAVTSAVVHPSGSVMATCSGQRKTFGLGTRELDSGSDNNSSTSNNTADDNEGTKYRQVNWDNSLKIWEISTNRSGIEVRP